MAFDFPSSPTDGQVFQPVAGVKYAWSAADSVWRQTGAGYVLSAAGPQNLIVNGAMQISQENGDNSASNGMYPADQWALVTSLAGNSANGTTSMPTTGGSPRTIANVIGTAKPSLAAGDISFIMYKGEGVHTAGLQWGTAAAKQVVLAFDILSPVVGTFPVAIRNPAGNRSWVGTYAIAASDINKFVRRVLAIPGDTTGTWPSGNVWSIEVDFTFACGSTYTTSTAGWQAGSFISLSGTTNGAAATGNFALGDVGLYVDPNNTGLAPPFAVPDYATELVRCQRYWNKIIVTMSGSVTSGNTYYAQGAVSPPLRTTPTFSGVSTAAIGFAAAVGTLAGNVSYAQDSRTSNATSVGGIFQSSITLNSRM